MGTESKSPLAGCTQDSQKVGRIYEKVDLIKRRHVSRLNFDVWPKGCLATGIQ